MTCAVALLLGTLTTCSPTRCWFTRYPDGSALGSDSHIGDLHFHAALRIHEHSAAKQRREILSARAKAVRNITLALLVGSGLLFSRSTINPDGRSALTLVLSAGFLLPARAYHREPAEA